MTRAVDPDSTARAVADPIGLVEPLLGAGATTGADCDGEAGACGAGATGFDATGAGVGATGDGDGATGVTGVDCENPDTLAYDQRDQCPTLSFALTAMVPLSTGTTYCVDSALSGPGTAGSDVICTADTPETASSALNDTSAVAPDDIDLATPIL